MIAVTELRIGQQVYVDAGHLGERHRTHPGAAYCRKAIVRCLDPLAVQIGSPQNVQTCSPDDLHTEPVGYLALW